MMKVLTVVGARPEFIQTAPVSRALRERHQEVLVHTGQHYDDNMSRVFFEDLCISPPEHHMGVGAGLHGQQTGRMLSRVEKIMMAERPDWVLVFGDTNSTVAAALAAAKLCLPLAHIEAGLRSFDRRMPEEVNRVVTDHLSQLLLSPTELAVKNLACEGISKGVELVGDVRVDVVTQTIAEAEPRRDGLMRDLGLEQGAEFVLATLHRPSNTDDKERLCQILAALGQLELPVVLPVHPRLAKMKKEFHLSFPANVREAKPLGFVDMMALMGACRMVITDSGGLQKEAYMAARSTVTLRDTTEWAETVTAGWNRLAEPEPEEFLASVRAALDPPAERPELYGAPGVAARIVDALERHHQARGGAS